jgi:hypothetical protein
MTANWYFARHKQKLGPFSWGQLRQLAAFDLLARTDYVWEEGTRQWREAGAVEGLFPRETTAKEYRLAIAGKAYGPYTSEQVRVFLLAGRLHPTTLAHTPGMAKWLPVTEIPDFTAYAGHGAESQAILVVGGGQALSKEEAELHLAGKSGDALARLVSRLMDVKRRCRHNTTLQQSLDRNIEQLMALREERGPWTSAEAEPG